MFGVFLTSPSPNLGVIPPSPDVYQYQEIISLIKPYRAPPPLCPPASAPKPAQTSLSATIMSESITRRPPGAAGECVSMYTHHPAH